MSLSRQISNILNKYVHQYKNMLIAGESNLNIGNSHLENLMHLFDLTTFAAKEMKYSIKNVFSKYKQTRRNLQILN